MSEKQMTEFIMRSTENGWSKYVGELVRCKECSWHYGTICRRNSTFPWEDDDYCSKAEVEE